MWAFCRYSVGKDLSTFLFELYRQPCCAFLFSTHSYSTNLDGFLTLVKVKLKNIFDSKQKCFREKPLILEHLTLKRKYKYSTFLTHCLCTALQYIYSYLAWGNNTYSYYTLYICVYIKSGHDPFVFSITFYGALWEGLTKQYGGGIGQYNIQVLILYSGSIKG